MDWLTAWLVTEVWQVEVDEGGNNRQGAASGRPKPDFSKIEQDCVRFFPAGRVLAYGSSFL